MQGRLARRVRGNLLRNCGCRGVFRQYAGSARYYAAPPGMFLHVMARSEATWQSVTPRQGAKNSSTLGEFVRRNEFAQTAATLPGFPAGRTDCHTSSPQSPPCSPPSEGQGGSNAPLGLLSPQRDTLCRAPTHWFAITGKRRGLPGAETGPSLMISENHVETAPVLLTSCSSGQRLPQRSSPASSRFPRPARSGQRTSR